MEIPFKFDAFVDRHIGPSQEEIDEMLKEIGVDSISDLLYKTVPDNILLKNNPDLGAALTEQELLNHMDCIAGKNKVFRNYIGMGYYSTILPGVIRRNILENPGWYTQYTPYQAEISQGRLEALLNFQTMVSELTAMPLANASLLDEATSAAEAMTMTYSLRKGERKKSNTILVSENIFPQTIDVLKTRAVPLDINVKVLHEREFELSEDVYAIIVQYPSKDGLVKDYESLFASAQELGIFKIVAADILSLALLKAPGEFGADVVVGSTQRFGIPLGFGGPHAAYFATKEEYKRSIPGRIIGVSVDNKGRRALRMALQTREQHIKREKATSNICTAQVLLAIMASMYAVYHGSDGIKQIANRIHELAKYLYSRLSEKGVEILNPNFFDTITIKLTNDQITQLKQKAAANEINLNFTINNHVTISLGEVDTEEDVKNLIELISEVVGSENKITIGKIGIPEKLSRTSKFLTTDIFNNYRSETELMRYIKSLEKKDLSLTTSMIPLGSCTMKLNAASELFALTDKRFSDIHPFAPKDQTLGYLELFENLKKQIGELTGLPGVSLQPNSGAQGEYAGLLVIRAYHLDNNNPERNIILIPSSAHGTNPASAVMAGNKVVIVKCDENGNIDVDDLKLKVDQNKENLAGLMVTYPSTHGVFEESIIEITKIIHDNGGLVYMDGANLNAQLGITSPATIGADVCHLNLHKTFAIPHGGGGPGVGPIAVTKVLERYLPSHSLSDLNIEKSPGAVSAAPWGSASVLTISYAYIKMMGFEGLKKASEIAILNSNYIKCKLKNHYLTLYTGEMGFVAHELIFDTRIFKQTSNIEVEDIAKRLMDYGYHAPTVSFPVPGTLMVEPTESESKSELDKFCEAMKMIYNEIKEIEEGKSDKEDNVLKNAPHILDDIISEWTHSYSIEKAVAPNESVKSNKFWPTVGRVDNAYGDRNLVCTCLPIEEYES